MSHHVVDLAAYINQDVHHGGPADFPVVLRPVSYLREGEHLDLPSRRAVVRTDTGAALAVVSNRYRLVTHGRLLDLIQEATASLEVGAAPRGIYVDRGGARMRAIFKFPALAQSVLKGDNLCPCLKIQNSYDGTSRIAIHIGAFRFVCTNLAVGGGGVFAGGFMAIHAGEIPIEDVAKFLRKYLLGFEAIIEMYRWWSEQEMHVDSIPDLLNSLPPRPVQAIGQMLKQSRLLSVYAAYNVATDYATHQMRSARGAFDLLKVINRRFQELYPVPSRVL